MRDATPEEAQRRWIEALERADFLVADPPSLPYEPLPVALDVPAELRRAVATPMALARDGYRLDARDAQREVVGYRLTPDKDGLWMLGADHHWGYARALFELEPLQHDVFTMLEQAGSDDWTLTFSRLDAAREAFRRQAYQESLDELTGLLRADDPTPGHVLEWRASFLLGLLRLGFGGGDLALVDLASAERNFAQAARHTRDTLRHVAVQALACAGFAALTAGGHDRAAGFLDAAARLDLELPEILWLRARVHAEVGEEDEAFALLGRLFALDRGYLLRSVAGGEPIVPAERLVPFLQRAAADVHEHGLAPVHEVLRKAAYWREHAGGAAEVPEPVARLDAFVREGAGWPVYDLLQVLGEREEMVAEVLDAAVDRRIVETTLEPGPTVEVEEPWTSVEQHRERVVARPATLFRKEEVAWVVRTRTVTHVRRSQRQLALRRTRLVDGAGRELAELRMIGLSPGAYFMGSPPDEPGRGPDEQRHMVTLTAGYFIADAPVTQRLWRAVMDSDPSFAPHDDAPVEQVTWLDAVRFCNALSALEGLSPAYELAPHGAWWLGPGAGGYRLPTEAEWEYACRAGTGSAFWMGAELPYDEANFERRPATRPSPVRSFAPNPWGLYDVHGGVWEWCFDSYRPHPASEVTDPVADVEHEARVARGGSWASDASSCRAAARKHFTPWHRSNNVGFRLALSRPPGT